jgi:hypothetical protein
VILWTTVDVSFEPLDTIVFGSLFTCVDGTFQSFLGFSKRNTLFPQTTLQGKKPKHYTNNPMKINIVITKGTVVGQ